MGCISVRLLHGVAEITFDPHAPTTSPGMMLTARVAWQLAERRFATDDKAAQIRLRRFGQIEDCAGMLEFLTVDLSQYVIGRVISVCGGALPTPS